jgi:hypothetical protein
MTTDDHLNPGIVAMVAMALLLLANAVFWLM